MKTRPCFYAETGSNITKKLSFCYLIAKVHVGAVEFALTTFERDVDFTDRKLEG